MYYSPIMSWFSYIILLNTKNNHLQSSSKYYQGRAATLFQNPSQTFQFLYIKDLVWFKDCNEFLAKYERDLITHSSRFSAEL